MLDSISVPIVALCLLVFYSINIKTLTRPMHYVYKNILAMARSSSCGVTKYQGKPFWIFSSQLTMRCTA